MELYIIGIARNFSWKGLRTEAHMHRNGNAKGVEGEECAEKGVPPPHPVTGSRKRRELPQHGPRRPKTGFSAFGA